MNSTRKQQNGYNTAIVTGSTRGIGKETALLLLKNGINVIISSRSQESVDNVIQEIHGKFPAKKENILGLKCDVSKYSDVKSLVDVSVKRFGKIDILVNNAGIVYYKTLLDTTEGNGRFYLINSFFNFCNNYMPHKLYLMNFSLSIHLICYV